MNVPVPKLNITNLTSSLLDFTAAAIRVSLSHGCLAGPSSAPMVALCRQLPAVSIEGLHPNAQRTVQDGKHDGVLGGHAQRTLVHGSPNGHVEKREDDDGGSQVIRLKGNQRHFHQR